MTGFWVVLLGGLVLLAVAALRDRQTRIRAERTLGAPVSQVHSRQPATPDATQQAALASFRERAQPVEARLADERFATWAGPPTAELADAAVLLCTEPPAQLRELLSSLERSGTRPLVVIAPAFGDELLTLLATPGNRCTPLLAEPEALEQLAELTGASPADRADLQSGWAVRCHGHVRRLVADATGCWLEPAAEAGPR